MRPEARSEPVTQLTEAVYASMVVQDFKAAQIGLILASNDNTQAQQLLRDMQASKYLYGFALVSDRKTLVPTIERMITANPGLPTVLVINYKFAGNQCESLLVSAKALSGAKIECVVTHPPQDFELRDKLSRQGATLYDEASALTLRHGAVH